MTLNFWISMFLLLIVLPYDCGIRVRLASFGHVRGELECRGMCAMYLDKSFSFSGKIDVSNSSLGILQQIKSRCVESRWWICSSLKIRFTGIVDDNHGYRYGDVSTFNSFEAAFLQFSWKVLPAWSSGFYLVLRLWLGTLLYSSCWAFNATTAFMLSL